MLKECHVVSAFRNMVWRACHNCSPAVDVKQKANPARHEDPTEASPPNIGKDINAPIVTSSFDAEDSNGSCSK